MVTAAHIYGYRSQLPSIALCGKGIGVLVTPSGKHLTPCGLTTARSAYFTAVTFST